MPRVVHFEFMADDPERAVRFYQNVFGWTIGKWDGPMEYWLVNTGPEDQPGIHGGISKREMPLATVVTVDVPDVDAYVAKVLAAGGEVAWPKMAIPGVGYLAYVKDSESNVIGLMAMDPQAK